MCRLTKGSGGARPLGPSTEPQSTAVWANGLGSHLDTYNYLINKASLTLEYMFLLSHTV